MRFLSLFSGIEAASVAWNPLGWECVGVAEIDPFPCAVLAHHYPGVPNLGSVTEISDAQIGALGPIDVVVGGSPCQDLSVAGKRAGLAGERSGLFHEQLRIFHAARHLCGARFLLWENVPGAFSANGGRDFAVVVGAMAGLELAVPADGWGTEGVALGENGLVEWCVLDAQWFGVAQRRRRVFAVLDTGDWSGRPPILLEPDRMRGDSAPRREAGKDASGSTGDGVARFFTTGEAKRQDWETCNFVAHSLRGEGFDASEDGTGRGTPLVPVGVTIHGTDGSAKVASYDELAQCLRARTPGNVDNSSTTVVQQPVAFSCKDYGADAGEIAPTLRSMGHDASHANAGGQLAVAFAENSRAEIRLEGGDGSRTGALNAGGGKPGQGVPTVAVAVALRGREGGATAELGDEVQNCLRASSGGGDKPHVLAAMQVRRLTPRECERLQGFPDGHTLIPYRGKPAADGNRYRALGNSMAVPVMRWIGERIQQVCMFQTPDQTLPLRSKGSRRE